MYMRNNVQLRAEPCGRPSSRDFLDEVVPLTLVEIVRSCKKVLDPMVHISLYSDFLHLV